MSAKLVSVGVYGLEVPAADIPVEGKNLMQPGFRLTMAALDPTAKPQLSDSNDDTPLRATLKIIRTSASDSDNDSEEQNDEDDEENGGPSDPVKARKALRDAAAKRFNEALKDAGDMEVDAPSANGTKLDKGKGMAVLGDDDSDDSEESEDDDIDQFVICTLDPKKHCQQPLDIVIGEHEQIFFKVSGSHNIFLTGNYVVPEDENDDFPDGSDESMDENDLEDELDDLADPRITEIESDEEEQPTKLIKADKKGKNKRVVEDDSADDAGNLDDIISKSLKPEENISKKKAKKLKNNEGKSVTNEDKMCCTETKDCSEQSSKKVQFSKALEQGSSAMTNGKADGKNLDKKHEKKGEKKDEKKDDKNQEKPNGLGVKVVQGVTIDDKKLGSGPAAKKGDKISMRYIGKLEKNGQVFDSNKKGKAFVFKLGVGEVIKGWDIGIVGITVGGERRITVPSKMGYGNKGAGNIPPNSNLIFDVKCLSIN